MYRLFSGIFFFVAVVSCLVGVHDFLRYHDAIQKSSPLEDSDTDTRPLDAMKLEFFTVAGGVVAASAGVYCYGRSRKTRSA